MCDSFVHIVKKLQGGNSRSQSPIDMNGVLHSNCVGLLKIKKQLVMGKTTCSFAYANDIKENFGRVVEKH